MTEDKRQPGEDPQQRAIFRSQLNADASAASAQSRLVRAGVPDEKLIALLHDASRLLRQRARLDKNPHSFTEALGLKDAQSVHRLVKKLRKLADELEVVDESLVSSGLPVAFAVPWQSGYFDILSGLNVPVSTILRAHASFLESTVPSVKRQPRIIATEVIEEFVVGFVKRHSGQPHYSEAAILLNWLYQLPGCGGFHTTEDALSHSAQRRGSRVNS